MAINVPMPQLPLTGLNQAIATGGNLFQQIMHPVIQRETNAREWRQHLDALAMQKAAQGRLAQAAADAHKLAMMKMDPLNEARQIEAIENYFRSKNNPPGEQSSFGVSPNSGDGYPALAKMFEGQGMFPGGEIEHGNVDLFNRPNVNNPETGGQSTVYSMSVGTPQGEVLIPRISDDGKILSEEDAIKQYKQTGKHLGVYSNVDEANKAAQAIHQQQEQLMNQKKSSPKIGGIDMELIKAHPMLRGWYKKHYGFDPLSQEKENVLHGAARDAADLAKLKEQVGENSEVYQNAKAQYDASLDAKKDLRDIRARTKAGLKTGEKEFFDPQTGEPLGKEIPLTAKEREAEEGNILFNELYPYVYKGAFPFSGEGSITRLENAAANYKTDPKARKLFDDFLLSDKVMAATAVNEASTLKSGHTNQTYNRLKESLESQDVPKAIKNIIKRYQIPASAQLKAAMRYQKILSDARIKARKGTPATQKLFYNPELQAQHEQQVNEGVTDSNPKPVIVIDPNGKQFETSEENAAHLPEGWKRG